MYSKTHPLILALFCQNLCIFMFVVPFRSFLHHLIVFSWAIAPYPNLGFWKLVFGFFIYRQNCCKQWTWTWSGKGDEHGYVFRLSFNGLKLILEDTYAFSCGWKSAGKITRSPRGRRWRVSFLLVNSNCAPYFFNFWHNVCVFNILIVIQYYNKWNTLAQWRRW